MCIIVSGHLIDRNVYYCNGDKRTIKYLVLDDIVRCIKIPSTSICKIYF